MSVLRESQHLREQQARLMEESTRLITDLRQVLSRSRALRASSREIYYWTPEHILSVLSETLSRDGRLVFLLRPGDPIPIPPCEHSRLIQ